MTLYYQHDGHFITVMGQTYPHRNAFKILGASFLGASKSWRLPFSDDKLAVVDGLCRQFGGGVLDQPPAEKTETEPADMKAPSDLRVSDLLNLLDGVIYKNFSSPIWVVGEVQNLNYRNQRGTFFNLAEQAGVEATGSTLAISAVLWSEATKRLEKKFGKDKIAELLQDGLVLRVLCQVQFYKGRATISLVVQDIDPEYTQGLLSLAREKLLKELRKTGLALANKQCALSAFPFRVGLVSAENSRALSDFVHQVQQGGFCGEMLFCPAAMQGEDAPSSVASAIKSLIAMNCDLIVLTRGGGSAADLRWFDTPEIAYAIAHCPIPIIAAIGHHDDSCVAEEICFQREKTPTAAADFVLHCFQKSRLRVEQQLALFAQSLDHAYTKLLDKQLYLQERLRGVAANSVARRQEALLILQHALTLQSRNQLASRERVLVALGASLPLQGFMQWRKEDNHLNELAEKLYWQAKLSLERGMVKLKQEEQCLKTFDPRPWLAKGWTQLWQEQKQVRSVGDLVIGSVLWTRLLDGLVKLQVTETEKKELGHD